MFVNNNKTKVVHFVYTPDIMSRASLHTRYRKILIRCSQYNYIGKLICVCNNKSYVFICKCIQMKTQAQPLYLNKYDLNITWSRYLYSPESFSMDTRRSACGMVTFEGSLQNVPGVKKTHIQCFTANVKLF